MRGAERPAKVQWSRPFIPPLAPFDGSAALQTFHEIAGDNEDPAIIQELLQLTGNLPLAVSLLANIAASDGCELALSRWATERTQLLSDGYDQTSSLDISITLSYTSPRMTPGAQELLSLLSILPDGISDADLVHSGINIPNILSCKATLIQTSLAYVDHHRFLQVLPPIREHIRRTYPVKAALTASLRQHFHAIIALWGRRKGHLSTGHFAQLSTNLGNFNALFLDALSSSSDDMEETLMSILWVNNFRGNAEMGASPLMAEVRRHIENWNNKPVYGRYLVEELTAKGLEPIDYELHISRGTLYFATAHGPDCPTKVGWFLALAYHYNFRGTDSWTHLRHCELLLSLVDQFPNPSMQSLSLLSHLAQVAPMLSRPSHALLYAREARKHAEVLGDSLGHASVMLIEGSIHRDLGNFERAGRLYRKALDILPSDAFQFRDLLKECQGKVHMRKTEYLDAKTLLEEVIESRQSYRPYDSIGSHATLAAIGVAMGSDPDMIQSSLAIARSQSDFVGLASGRTGCDIIAADLLLRCYIRVRGRGGYGRSMVNEGLRRPRYSGWLPDTTMTPRGEDGRPE
ncbi:hypothetical protein C8F04DRAFT_1262836 [Mycena alexandri]|uniref:Uncharacterized protein n=1 Tax=Mycena alexandri TaxID=1745969 RepID=A0AAD6SPT6_9AGAR|nr:hypothetical protein C8F04DRAFT_1262836 [Mycena alexandri]